MLPCIQAVGTSLYVDPALLQGSVRDQSGWRQPWPREKEPGTTEISSREWPRIRLADNIGHHGRLACMSCMPEVSSYAARSGIARNIGVLLPSHLHRILGGGIPGPSSNPDRLRMQQSATFRSPELHSGGRAGWCAVTGASWRG